MATVRIAGPGGKSTITSPKAGVSQSAGSSNLHPPEAVFQLQQADSSSNNKSRAARFQQTSPQLSGAPSMPSSANSGYSSSNQPNGVPVHHHYRLTLDKKSLLKKIGIAAVTLFVDLGLPIALYFILRVSSQSWW